ncbi:MAG: PEP-CTERM sorting domain-containing protein [Phycisphaeraceae bacterium]|nr:PEP-CTERM sorting domain-containing protein [Phycisphaeraceae bacterium]
MKKLCEAALLVVFGSACAATQAATITPVFAPPANEKSHEQIIEDILGGDFSQTGNDFTDGVRTVARVDDDADQSYDFASWSVLAQAVWAGASQSFGTVEDGVLFIVGGDESSVSGSAFDPDGGQGIVFKRFGSEYQTLEIHTDPAQNPNGQDHVVTYTYTVDDVDGPVTSYLLFFEDLNETSPLADWDYNDLVVELRGTPLEQDTLTPEPGSLVLMGAGVLVLLRRRR